MVAVLLFLCIKKIKKTLDKVKNMCYITDRTKEEEKGLLPSSYRMF